MDQLDNEALLKLYPAYDTVYAGMISQGRRVVCLYKAGGSKRTSISYAKALMEVYLGERIKEGYEVDHKDNNKLNDVLDNLQVITGEENRAKQVRLLKETTWRTPIDCVCPTCDTKFEAPLGRVLAAQKRKKSNYCSRSCSAKATSKGSYISL